MTAGRNVSGTSAMNGAERLARTLVEEGVDTCFANPGTSEMHFVAALDRVDGVRCIPGLFEGVVTGAADGYGRMAGRPAATLLHLGPGLANGLANLHNARRARTPVVNIVGDHAVYHRPFDAPLTSDVEGTARPYSDWVRTIPDANHVRAYAQEAVAAAGGPAGQVATLVLPADAAWGEVGREAIWTGGRSGPPKVPDEAIARIARIFRSGGPCLLLLGDGALTKAGLAFGQAISEVTGCRVLGQTFNRRAERGAGHFTVECVPYPIDRALELLKPYETIVLAGADDPVAFFAYPGKPSRLRSGSAAVERLAGPTDDVVDALARVADLVGRRSPQEIAPDTQRPDAPNGSLTAATIAAAVARYLPENAIVADESIGTGRAFQHMTRYCAPHSWIHTTGGAIGAGPPLATGAAIACPDRPVWNLQADGSAMFTIQALWTQARENLDVTTLVFNNGSYASLTIEMANVGAADYGAKARDMLEIDRPRIDFARVASGLGVPSATVTDAAELARLLEARGRTGLGPMVIDVRVSPE